MYNKIEMTRPVIISTPMSTLGEIGKELGLSKAEQSSLIRLVNGKASRRPATNGFETKRSLRKRTRRRMSGRR
jgi:hypothetical protein